MTNPHTRSITLPPDTRILVVKMAGIGDLLLATPALRALRESYPQAHIDLLVTPEASARLSAEKIDTANTHGTGCTLSSAIAASRARPAPRIPLSRSAPSVSKA